MSANLDSYSQFPTFFEEERQRATSNPSPKSAQQLETKPRSTSSPTKISPCVIHGLYQNPISKAFSLTQEITLQLTDETLTKKVQEMFSKDVSTLPFLFEKQSPTSEKQTFQPYCMRQNKENTNQIHLVAYEENTKRSGPLLFFNGNYRSPQFQIKRAAKINISSIQCIQVPVSIKEIGTTVLEKSQKGSLYIQKPTIVKVP